MLCMSIGLLAQAAPITQQQAQQEATNFLRSKQKTNSNLRFAAKGNPSIQAAASSDAAYYIFNIGNNQGFVIVAGDDRINPILGFSNEGYFDEAKAPQNMKNLLNEYAQQIALLDKVSGIEGAIAAPRTKSVVDTRNSIAPLLTT